MKFEGFFRKFDQKHEEKRLCTKLHKTLRTKRRFTEFYEINRRLVNGLVTIYEPSPHKGKY